MNVPRAQQSPALFLALLASLGGCGGGGYGDPPSEPLGNEYGNGDRLCEVVGEATWLDAAQTPASCNKPLDHGVYATGVSVIAIDRFDETGDGAVGNYYVQDTVCAGKPYSGMTVFSPSFSPPDLRLADHDVVDINGQLTEFIGPASSNFGYCRTLPEISGTLIFRFDGHGPPAPVVVDVAELKSYATARPWLGMLVKVENLTLASNGANSGGRFTAQIAVGGGVVASDVPRITNELYDIEGAGPELKEGAVFKSVTGVLTYFYGFHIAPRSPADFEQ